MPSDCISFQESGYFSKLIVDYLNQEPRLKDLYTSFPSPDNYLSQLHIKQKKYSNESRKVLFEAVKKQYESIAVSSATEANINQLLNEKTFTITTGHQLNIFTGPLYFIYKIITTIITTQKLKKSYPTFNFVPVYWMATEDHDFDEINHFNLNDKKIKWDITSNGPVGRLSTNGLEVVFEEFKKEIGIGNSADYLIELFQNAYLKHSNLVAATRYLTNELFKAYGLVIIDADDKKLKKIFTPYIKDEILNQKSFLNVNKSNSVLKDYFIQVNPRPINLFYIEDELRERIVQEGDTYKVLNTTIQFNQEEILKEIENHPEKFSPNVILRPLYQEIILPNLGYIGGGGEIAYWLQLKSNFDAHNIPFPILQLRNSALIVSKKQVNKIKKLDLSWQELFMNKQLLLDKKTKELSQINFDFSKQISFLEEQFKSLEKIALQTDSSFIGAVKAQEAKQIKGLKKLEKRLLKAEKRKYKDYLTRVENIQNELFPNGSLQERIANFATFFDSDFLNHFFKEFDPFANNFTIIKMN